jgi:hypothetical protein
LELEIPVSLLSHHGFAALCHVGIVLLRCGRLLSVGVSLLKGLYGEAAFLRLESWVDDLVLLVHVGAEFRTGLRLVEFERLWLGRCDTFFPLLHLSDECLLKLAEVGN